MKGIFIGIGANLGDPLKQCQEALRRLHLEPGIRVVATASFYQSSPLVPEGKSTKNIPDYVNTACRIHTSLPVKDLLSRLHEIETKMGRQRKKKWESRLIDLDLLFYDEIIMDGPIKIPHPELHKRKFVMAPMSEIAPDFMHPVFGKTIKELLSPS